jgi:catechol 2,3-dioxygenase-like lactoylglutathione lyase family enzyme
MISHLLETSLYVEDLGRAAAFYKDVLGFPVMLQDDRMIGLQVPGSAVLLLFLRGGSTTPSPTPGGLIPAHDGRGTQHLCFAIPVAALQDWDRHLMARGVTVESRVIQTHGGTSLYFRDPDGHSVEVATPGLWPNF